MVKISQIKAKKLRFLNGSVWVNFCGLRFRLNRFKHSVKRFDRFGLDTLLQWQKTAFLELLESQKLISRKT